MDASPNFWFPTSWAMFGAICTFASFVSFVYAEFVRSAVVPPQLGDMVSLLEGILKAPAGPRPEDLEAVRNDVEALRMTLAPPGGPTVEALRDEIRELRTDVQSLEAALREAHRTIAAGLMTDSQAPAPVLPEIRGEVQGLRTDMQSLEAAHRETHGTIVAGLMTDSQAPAPVLPEILAHLRRLAKGDPMVQRQLPSFSFSGFGRAYAEGLARERMQANSSSFQDVD